MKEGSSPVLQWVMDPELSLLQFGLLLCCEFRPWLGFPHAQCVAQKEKKKKGTGDAGCKYPLRRNHIHGTSLGNRAYLLPSDYQGIAILV